MTDKIREDFRKSVKFLLLTTPYTEDNLMRKSIIEFMDILREAETEQLERLAKQKENERK